jgi:uncharacterized LabA/DUF88 family protein
MKKAAILVDGEWFRRRLDHALGARLQNGVTADVLYRNALLALGSDEEIFRIFYYDCPPFSGTEVNPIDQSQVNFETMPKHRARLRFLKEIKKKDYIAVRLGIAKKRGWTLTDQYINAAINGNHTAPTSGDVFLGLEQKGVDMRIGIDVATLSLKKIVDRIVLISGDTDMIPAMKLARREGVQVVLVEVATGIHKDLDEDADLCR